jgi:hypothetical protein
MNGATKAHKETTMTPTFSDPRFEITASKPEDKPYARVTVVDTTDGQVVWAAAVPAGYNAACKMARALGGVGCAFQAVRTMRGYSVKEVASFPSIGHHVPAGPVCDTAREAIDQADDGAEIVLVRDALPGFFIYGAFEIAR